MSSGLTPRLADAHALDLGRSALSPELIERLTRDHPAGGGGFHQHDPSHRVDRSPRLLMPYWNPDGSPVLAAHGKPFVRWKNYLPPGSTRPRYCSPRGSGCRVYHSHLAILGGGYERRLADRNTRLRVTEGEKKVEAAAVHDRQAITIGFGGVTSWVDHRNPVEGSRTGPIPELEAIPVDGRVVELCFDSDLHKPQVRAALKALADYLHERGAHVLITVLPNGLQHSFGSDGQEDRLGLDDLIHRHGAAAFCELSRLAVPAFKAGRGGMVFNLPMPYEPDLHHKAVVAAMLLASHWTPAPHRGWWHWTGNHWRQVDADGDDAISAAIEQVNRSQDWRRADSSTISSLRQAVRRRLLQGHARPPGGLQGGLVAFRNGVLDVSTRQLHPHHPSRGNTWVLPFDWDPAADPQPVVEFLTERLGEGSMRDRIRAAGHCLLTATPVKAFLEVWGDGDSGKSVLVALLQALVGAGNYEAGKLEHLENPNLRFELARFQGVRLAIFSEAQGYHGPLENLKAMTSGGTDPIRCERKNQNGAAPFHFKGLVVITGNAPIKVIEAGSAVVNRRRGIHLNKPVPAHERRTLLEFSDELQEWQGPLAAALPGFARWCLDMGRTEAINTLQGRGIHEDAALADLQAEIESDPISGWVDAQLVLDPLGVLRIGLKHQSPAEYGLPNYREFIDLQADSEDPKGEAINIKNFKPLVVAALRRRDAPIPAGDIKGGLFHERGKGSIIPGVRLRGPGDEHLQGALTASVIQSISTGAGMTAAFVTALDGPPPSEMVGARGTDSSAQDPPDPLRPNREWIGNGSGTDWKRLNPSRERMEQIPPPIQREREKEREGECVHIQGKSEPKTHPHPFHPFPTGVLTMSDPFPIHSGDASSIPAIALDGATQQADLTQAGTDTDTAEPSMPAAEPAWLPLLGQVQAENPGAHPYTLGLLLEQRGGPRIAPLELKPWIERLAQHQDPAA
jgi:hypothetical protein